jgi:SapC
MATTPESDTSQIAGNVLFYSTPEPLNKETHGKIGLRRNDRPFAFAAKSQIAPLTVTEFPVASLSFPIIFAGDRRQPLAVMGVNADTNMFVSPDGSFELGVYVPAYIRRYPFVLARDQPNEQLVVCIDRAASMLGDLPDLPFFDASGEPTEYTKGCINFCNDYEVETRRTESFVGLLTDLDLLETRKTNYTPTNPDGTAGEPQEVAEYFAVSEDRLKALPDAKIRELLDNGALGHIYAHLHSIIQWDRLLAITVARLSAAPPAANMN